MPPEKITSSQEVERKSFVEKVVLENGFKGWRSRDFPGGAVVKNPPANAGDTGSSPGPRRSHMLWSN